MEEMKVMLIMLGLIVGGVIAWIVYTNISNNVAKNSKNIAKKAEHIIKKDMSSKCARCTFYMNNDYDNGYSQSEWLKAFKESVIDKEWDKESEEYAEAVAPFINAIVVDDTNYYLRRGMENMAHTCAKFQPGVNDRVSLNYFVEPYEYIEDEENRKCILFDIEDDITYEKLQKIFDMTMDAHKNNTIDSFVKEHS